MPRRLGLAAPLWLRLAFAFVGVGVAGVALLAGLTLASTNAQVASLRRDQQHETTAAVVASVGMAYRTAGGWTHADLEPALALAGEAGASVAVLDSQHRLVKRGFSPAPASQQGPGATSQDRGSTTESPSGQIITTQVTVARHDVGSVAVRFPSLEPAGVVSLRSHLVRAVAVGAGLAALLAMLVALVVSRRITRPVATLTRIVRARKAGDRDARVGKVKAAGELAELAAEFDRMADASSREDQLRRTLVADVAHELRTPISVLQASCEGILDGVVTPTSEVISSIHDEVLRLATRVEDLQVLASAEAAGLRLAAEPVDLAEVAREAASALASGFAAANVELATDLEPVTVAGDRARLHQIITNLLTNALKFTPARGGARLEVRGAGSTARLTVADSGPGMSAEELGHVFERFWRGAGAASTQGSGIGLAVVQELVSAHHGTIETRSEPGRGTTFVISLPRV